jgi:small multidrug resistance pump
MGYFYLSVAILCEVAGTAALKASDAFSRPLPSLLVVVGYALAFLCLSLTLRTIPVGVAYAIWAGAGIVLIALASHVLFGQRLDAPALLGMALIAAGVIIINAFSTSLQR